MTSRTLCLAALLASLCCIGCGRGRHGAVEVVGSTSIQPFAELLDEEFDKIHPEIPVDVQGGGSAQGLATARSGMADIGMCSRDLTPEEKTTVTPILIARDGLAIVVHPTNPIENLTRGQIRELFTGAIENWKEVGGPDRPVRLIMREEGSGTREAFMKLVMGKARVSRKALEQESNGAVKELVKGDPCGIGYMSLGLVGGELRAVKVDGIEPTAANVSAGKYAMARPFLFVVKGKPDRGAQTFIDFVLSEPGQWLLQQEGLVPVR